MINKILEESLEIGPILDTIAVSEKTSFCNEFQQTPEEDSQEKAEATETQENASKKTEATGTQENVPKKTEGSTR